MTRKLEEMLDLDSAKDVINQENEEKKQKDPPKEKRGRPSNVEKALQSIGDFDKISEALPAVKGLGEMADAELNEVSDKAMSAYEDLMDLGMNVESRYSGRIFEVANNMLRTNLDAKVAKLDKKLKMVEMQLKKEKQDKDSKAKGDSDIVNGEGYVVTDRNSLLEKLKGLDKDK